MSFLPLALNPIPSLASPPLFTRPLSDALLSAAVSQAGDTSVCYKRRRRRQNEEKKTEISLNEIKEEEDQEEINNNDQETKHNGVKENRKRRE